MIIEIDLFDDCEGPCTGLNFDLTTLDRLIINTKLIYSISTYKAFNEKWIIRGLRINGTLYPLYCYNYKDDVEKDIDKNCQRINDIYNEITEAIANER